MSSSNRGWLAFTVVGLTTWIGATVLVTLAADDPSSGRPTLLAFAAGAALFFGVMFGVAWWQTRPRRDPDLDTLLAELAIDQSAVSGRRGAGSLVAMRFVGRAYIVLGAIVTTLGLAAVVQEATGSSARATLTAMLVIVVLWALAIPLVITLARRTSAAMLAPLGLIQSGAALEGERHGRDVWIEATSAGWVTQVYGVAAGITQLEGEAVLARAGRGHAETWRSVSVECDDRRVVVRRRGHSGPAWLWDLWLAERLLDN
jgi:hypothetical protein